MKHFAITLLFFHVIVFAHAQYSEGYYIDNSGARISGLLHYTFGGNAFSYKSKGDCRLHFKADSAAEDTKFTSKEIRGFVIGTDSFTVIYNFSINAYVHYPQDFAHVLEVGPIMLYQYDAEMGGGPGGNAISYWIVKKNDTTQLLSNGNFKELMAKWTMDDPALHDKITGKEVKFKNTREVVRQYNTDNRH